MACHVPRTTAIQALARYAPARPKPDQVIGFPKKMARLERIQTVGGRHFACKSEHQQAAMRYNAGCPLDPRSSMLRQTGRRWHVEGGPFRGPKFRKSRRTWAMPTLNQGVQGRSTDKRRPVSAHVHRPDSRRDGRCILLAKFLPSTVPLCEQTGFSTLAGPPSPAPPRPALCFASLRSAPRHSAPLLVSLRCTALRCAPLRSASLR